MASWGKGTSASPQIIEAERDLERAVSVVLARMDVLWLPIDDEPGPKSLRGYIERNAIALLSAYQSKVLDPPSSEWLGRYCPRDRIRSSGLWNSNHIGEPTDADFPKTLERLINGNAGAVFTISTKRPAPLVSLAHSGGNMARIINALREGPDLDDDTLSVRSGVKPDNKSTLFVGSLKRGVSSNGLSGRRAKSLTALLIKPQVSPLWDLPNPWASRCSLQCKNLSGLILLRQRRW